MKNPYPTLVAIIAALAMLVAACGDDAATAGGGTDTDRPSVVVTTNILGDVVENLVGDNLDVVTIMPVGADPHDFQASARQVAEIGEAEVLVVNGAGFEEGLLDVIEAAEADGVPVLEAITAVETIEFGEGGHDHDEDDHADEGDHDDEDHADEGDHDDEEDHEHDHEGVDPHFFTDPARMALAAGAIAEFLIVNVEGIDAEALRAGAETYIGELEALDSEVADTLAAIDEQRRVLVTNHEVFGYFADRYDFELIGTVIPAGSTVDGASAQELAELAELLEHEGVPAIFADTSSSDELAQTLADEVGDIDVIELFSESLGADGSDGGTYVDMVRANAQRIVDALAGG